MPKRKTKSRPSPAQLGWLAAAAVVLFALGEVFLLSRSDTGQVRLARQFGIGDRARVTRIVGKGLRRALEQCGIPADSVREIVVERGAAPIRWRVGLKPDAAPIQVNYAVTRTLEEYGATVLRGREGWTSGGHFTVTLLVGLPKRATHEVVLVRAHRAETESLRDPARLAIILYGFGEDAAAADSVFALAGPFAVAVAPAGKSSGAMFRAAHQRKREVVLHLPLEPINYPQVNPGPGTLLVTMKPARIASEVRRYLDQAEPVTAVANHMGSLATQDMTVMTAVYRELKKSRLPFLHVMPAAGAVCKSLAADMGVIYDEPDVVIDGETRANDAKALERRWKQVLKESKARGRMLVMVRVSPLTRKWLPGALEARRLEGVSLVPVASLVHPPAAI